MPAVNSDHCPVVLSIDFDNFSKGKGLWKFDSKLLNEREFVDSTRKCIADTCAKYVIFPEYANFFQECTNDQLDLFRGKSPEELQSLNYNIDYNLLLEMLLNDIRNNTISYTIAKKRNDAKNEKDLLKDIVKLQLKSLEEETPDNLAALKEKEDLYLEIVTRKADRNIFFRSAKMKIQGEKPTSFFCKLEKCLATKKYVSNLIVEKNGAENEIRSQKDIEKELCNFYKNLYKCKDDKIEIENISDFLGNDASCNKLDQQAAESLEKEISSDELLAVLKKTNSSSAPGSTGFNYAFYKFFWRNLGGFITNAAKFSFESGNLPKSQRYGIITLLPKGKKDQRYLKNWRPLTMLNCIYKLISGTIANRINEKLHLIIHNEQSGFVRGRFIGEAIRSTYDTLEWAKKNKKKGLILLIDFFKAFDCINFKFIIKTLRYFGFKENIIKWISIILKDFSASVNHAGNISMIFDILSGCRQGDPLSPVIFIMAIEILCIKLRQDKKLKGFSIENLEMMLSLYADDCTIYLEYDGDNLRHCLKIMKDFHRLSGLEMQVEKTQCIVMGNGNDDVINLCPEMNLIWDQNFTLLGIDFNANLDNMDKNFDSKLKDIENVISKWQYRILSPIGRCCIAKTLLLSKLSNLAIVLPCLKPSMLKKIEDLIFRFIWKGPDKVARETAKLHILQGGLSMPDIKSSWMSYKMAWFRRLYNSNAKWTDIFNLLINKVHNNYSLSNFFTLGLNDYDVLGKKTDSSFWSECIKTIKPFMLELVKQYPEKLLVTVLWGSVFFTQNDRPLRTKLYPSLAGKILCPIDIIDANMNEIRFKEFNEICASYGNINEDEYISLKVAISQTFMKNKFNLADMDKSNLSMPYAPSFIQLINLSLKGCSKWTRLLKKNTLTKTL